MYEYTWRDNFSATNLSGHEPKPTNRPRILSLGLGVDSTAMLLLLTAPVDQAVAEIRPDALEAFYGYREARFDAVVFADPGAEKESTYELLMEYVVPYCEERGIPLYLVRRWTPNHGLRSLEGQLLDTGAIPFIGTSAHTCSLKYKVEPQQWFVDQLFGGVITEPGSKRMKGDRPDGGGRLRCKSMNHDYEATFLVGMNADENRRVQGSGAYTVKNDGFHMTEFPMYQMGLTRADERRIIRNLAPGWPEVVKSSCVFCPFMTECEAGEQPRGRVSGVGNTTVNGW